MGLTPDQERHCGEIAENAPQREDTAVLEVSTQGMTPPAPGQILAPGDLVGQQFAIEGSLGRGGMGEVYLARDTRLHRHVAIKILPEQVGMEPDRRQRFEREARAVAALNHPNICAVYQFGSDRGRDYIVLEYLDGCTLLKRLREGALWGSEWKRAAQEISSALEYAHQQGVIHRDVKPGNIMLTRAGAKLLDFSIAKQVSAVFRSVATSSPSTVLTKEGSIVGTVAYMSPEQAEGKPVDARSDIFSFGCVLYEMITGQPAFHGNSDLSVLAAILNSEPADLRGLPPGSSASLLNVMDRCLRKRPEERFQTMAEVSQALARIDEQEDIHGDEPSTSTWQSGGLPALVQRAGQVASDRSLAVGAALLAVLAACFVFWNIHRVSPVHPRSLAVLPFANASKNPEMEYLADGLSESLTNTFSRASNMRVTARSAAFAYKGRDADVRKIGRDLRVESVVMGSVTSAAGRMRVQAELVDTRDGTQLWGQQYEGTLNDALKIRDDIMRQLSERMQGRVEIQEGGARGRPTQNPEAFQLYLKGRHALSRYSVADVQRAISYFDKALEMDPNYALAYAGLAESYWTLSGNALPPGEAFPKAKAAAQRAMALDPGLPDAHVALGVIHNWYDFAFSEAERELRRAVELASNDAAARLWLGWALVLNTHFEEGIAQAKLAHELDPMSPFIETGLGQMFYCAGQPNEAIRRLRDVVAADPTFYNGHHYLGIAYLHAHQYAEAAGEFREANRLDASQPYPVGHLAYAHAMLGDRVRAEEYLRQLYRFRESRYVSKYLFALVSLGLGDHQSALRWLREALGDRDDMIAMLKVDHLLDPLRSSPEFKSLLVQAGM